MVLAQRQTQLRRTVVCEHSHALAGVDDGLTIYGHDILVALRNHSVVVRETALNLAANDDRAAKLKACVLRAESNLHLFLLFRQQVLEQICRLLRQNETCSHTCSHAHVRVTNQTVSVSSHHRHFIRCDVEEDTVHHRTQIIVRRAEDSLLNRALQHVCRHSNRLSIILSARHLRILVAVHAYERIRTVLANHVYGEVILVNRESQRLLAELLQRLQQQLSRRSNLSTTFYTVNLYRCTNSRLTVRSGQFKLISY